MVMQVEQGRQARRGEQPTRDKITSPSGMVRTWSRNCRTVEMPSRRDGDHGGHELADPQPGRGADMLGNLRWIFPRPSERPGVEWISRIPSFAQARSSHASTNAEPLST
jgi:hypothetical protein